MNFKQLAEEFWLKGYLVIDNFFDNTFKIVAIGEEGKGVSALFRSIDQRCLGRAKIVKGL